jgi:hypothetical protein
MTKYTLYIVTRNSDHHYPVIMANNGKQAFNEPVRRAGKLELSLDRFTEAIRLRDFRVIRITEKDFKAKFPKFAPNKGRKKPKAPAFKKGDLVTVNAGVWGQQRAKVTGKGSTPDSYQLEILVGKYAGKTGVWTKDSITPA